MAQASRLVSLTMANRVVLVFLVLQLGDILTTLVGLRVGAAELNPFAASIFGWMGPGIGIVSMKMIGAAVIVAAVTRATICQPSQRLHWGLLRAANVGYAFVVAQNANVVLNLLGVYA
ncbi:MAG: DUF5658 family protein [Chloroflexota bacterium]